MKLRCLQGARRKVGFAATIEQHVYTVGEESVQKREQWKAAAAERVHINASRRTPVSGRRGSGGATVAPAPPLSEQIAARQARRGSRLSGAKVVLDPNDRPVMPPPPPGAACDADGNLVRGGNPRRQLWSGGGELSVPAPEPPGRLRPIDPPRQCEAEMPPTKRRSLREVGCDPNAGFNAPRLP